MNKANRRKIELMLKQGRLPHMEIAEMPAVLYFPPKLLDDLHKFLEYNECTPDQLVFGALKLQLPHWKKFYKFVMTPLKPGEPEVWPEDPMFALACVAFLHWIRTFIKLCDDPDGFDQLKKDAPAEWSFRSIEDLDNDRADSWKADK